MAYITPLGQRDVQLTVTAIPGGCHPIGALYWHHCLTCRFTGLAKCSQEDSHILRICIPDEHLVSITYGTIIVVIIL